MHQADRINRHEEPVPHELANELTRDASVRAESSVPQTQSPPPRRDRDTLPAVERRVGRSILVTVLACASIGLIVASIMMRNTALALIAAVFIVPFMLLVSAPVWMANATKAAQDQTVREQRRETA